MKKIAIITVLAISAMGAQAHSGVYLGLGVGISPQNDNASQSYTTTGDITETNKDSNQQAIALMTRAGYQWQLSEHLQWAVGLAYMQTAYKTKGATYDESGTQSSTYSYNTQNQNVFLENRLYFTTSQLIGTPKTYSGYVGFLIGQASNKSSHYQQSINPAIAFTENTQRSTVAGLEVGGNYQLNEHNSLGLNVAYLSGGKQGFKPVNDANNNHYELNTTAEHFLVSAEYTYLF